MAKQEEVIIDVEVDETDAVESIESLTAANKELRKERNALNLATVEGKKRAQELNAQIDSNTSKIKENVSAIEKQKINIGNYKSALDGVHPALGKVGEGLEAGTSGFKAMTLQALRFIATPIGAILAGLVFIFTSLKAAISTNNEILDKFENVTTAISDVVDVLVLRLGKLGSALVSLFSGDVQGAIDQTSEAFTGLGDAISDAVSQGQLYLELSRKLEDDQRQLTIQTAKQENEIRRLVVAAKARNLTFDEQEDLLRKALALEEELVKKREDIALRDLQIFAKNEARKEGIFQQTEETFDAFLKRITETGTDDLVDPLIEKITALEQARGSSLAFQEKLENQLTAIQEKRAEALAKQNAALEEQARQERAVRRAQNIAQNDIGDDPLVGAFETRANVITDINDRMNKDLAARNKKFEEEEVARKEKSAEMQVQVERSKAQIIGGLTASLANLAEQDTAEHKVLASATALINTYLAATAALASGSEINPVFGIISAAAAIANGLNAVARINGIEFAEGGYTGPGGKYDVAGTVHKGEVVWSQEDVRRAGGPHVVNAMRPTFPKSGHYGFADGGLVANSVTAPINQQMEIANIMKSIPAPVLDVSEVSTVQKRIAIKEKISRR